MSKSMKTMKITTITLALVMAASVSIGFAAQRGAMMDQNTTTTRQGRMMNQQGYQSCPNGQYQNGNGTNGTMMNQRGGMMNNQGQRYANCPNNQYQRGNTMNNQGGMMNQGNGMNRVNTINN